MTASGSLPREAVVAGADDGPNSKKSQGRNKIGESKSSSLLLVVHDLN
jgi:hypothetical protein